VFSAVKDGSNEQILSTLKEDLRKRLLEDLLVVENKKETIQFLKECVTQQRIDDARFLELYRNNQTQFKRQHFLALFSKIEADCDKIASLI
jgi:hypothetical protein